MLNGTVAGHNDSHLNNLWVNHIVLLLFVGGVIHEDDNFYQHIIWLFHLYYENAQTSEFNTFLYIFDKEASPGHILFQ